MSQPPDRLQPSTPESSAGFAQSRDVPPPPPCPEAEPVVRYRGEGADFDIDSGVVLAAYVRPYERRGEDPIYRPLRIFTRDPAESRLEGAVAMVNVPYEPLGPGPLGGLLHVDDYDSALGDRYRAILLDAPEVLIRSGRDPSPSDHHFHQQMVYAVCSTTYAAFRQALGRYPAWGFRTPPDQDGTMRLRVRPHAFRGANAYYDGDGGEICFGYYKAADDVQGRNLPCGFVFTCLSHDVIVHEMTHALLDGMRAHFDVPSGPDVLAFHEGFADLVAIFQHFSYKEVVEAGIRRSRGQVDRARLLTDLATQFGHTTGQRRALRTAVHLDDQGETAPREYDGSAPPHELGSVLVSAVFEAFATVFRRKTERYVRLATGGTGRLPEGEIPTDLQRVLAEEASQLANQFLTLCIRAIDHCPPVDLELGEYLRAVITADRDLVPDDPWAYREAWVDAFRRHRIFPPHVPSLHEDALLWRAPERSIRPVEALTFAELRFQGDPARAASERELQRQAGALGWLISRPGNLEQFGLAQAGPVGSDLVERPRVHSIRSSRRVGPDGQVVFDLVAEVTQRRIVRRGSERFDFYGGATAILGPGGEVRYVIAKNVLNEDRLERQWSFLRNGGAAFWQHAGDGTWTPRPQPFKLLHENAPATA